MILLTRIMVGKHNVMLVTILQARAGFQNHLFTLSMYCVALTSQADVYLDR